MSLPSLKKAKLKKAPPLLSLLGPSFILLGLGLGSGEVILWPYLSSHYGLGIIWGAVLGITLQFFINMEIARYTLATGESVFVGLSRRHGILSPVWFLLSTIIPWMWPGIIASSATLFAAFLGINYSAIIPIIFLLLIGIIYTLGPVIYKTQESLQKIVILLGVPFVFGLAIYFAHTNDWLELAKGLVGSGNGYFLIPVGISGATFLAAFAYAGAGGNLNLGQSLYVKEKGYGMGAQTGKMTSVLTGKKQKLTLTGYSFENNKQNLVIFKDWWRKINIEHGVLFWATGAITMLLLALLSFSTVYGKELGTGITFVIKEASEIGKLGGAILGSLFLLVTSIMLFFTQFSVFGTTSRICTENLLLLNKKIEINNSSKYFYVFLWLQIILGIIVFLAGFTQPLTLVVIGAVLNAFSMFVYTGLILLLNKRSLYKSIQPGKLRVSIISFAFLFYGGFSIFTIFQEIQKLLN